MLPACQACTTRTSKRAYLIHSICAASASRAARALPCRFAVGDDVKPSERSKEEPCVFGDCSGLEAQPRVTGRALEHHNPEPSTSGRAQAQRQPRQSGRRNLKDHTLPFSVGETREAVLIKKNVLKPLYLQLRAKYQQDPQSLTKEEMKFYVNSLPKKFRIDIQHNDVVRLFDSNALNLDIAKQCTMMDLNRSVRRLCSEGHVAKAAKLVAHLVDICKYNQHTFAVFFDGCASRCDLSSALHHWIIWAKAGLLEDMGAAGSCALLKCVIASDLDRVSDVMVILHDWGAPMNNHGYNTLIHAYSRHGRLSDALDIFGLMQLALDPKLLPDYHTYTYLLEGVLMTGRYNLVPHLHRHLVEQGVLPDAPLAAALIKGFGLLNDLDSAEALFRSLESWGVQPNRFHFNALLIAYARGGNVPRCDELLREMLDASLIPDSHTIVALLTAASHAPSCTADQVSAIIGLMEYHAIPRNEYISTGHINAIRNCRMMDPAARKVEGLREFASMQQERIRISAAAVNTIIRLLSECGDPAGALGMLDKMSQMGVEPTERTYTLLYNVAMDEGWVSKAAELEDLKQTMKMLVGIPSRTGRHMR